MRMHAGAGTDASVVARPPSTLRLLVIESDAAANRWIERTFRRSLQTEFTITVARTLADGLAELSQSDPDVVLLGVDLPDAIGLAGLTALRAEAPELAIVVALGRLDTDAAAEALVAGAQDVIVGDHVDVMVLADALRKAVHRTRSDLLRRATTEPLTGLANRAAFEREVGRRLRDGAQTTVLFLDLDHFKVVNDAWGHAVGDDVLRAVAHRIATVAANAADRDGAPQPLVARFGGDEFLVATSDADAADAVPLTQEFLAAIEEPLLVDGSVHRLSASIGVAASGGDPSVAALLRRADSAMYEAKRHGGTFRLHEPDVAARRTSRALLHRGLVQAIDDEQLDVWYQPIVDLSTHRTVCLEALVRWTHPAQGPMTPSRFVAEAERSQLIHELGRFVAQRAVRDLAAGRHDTAGEPPVGLAINVSVVELQHERFAERLLRLLDLHVLAPERICLEITETMVAGDLGACAESLRHLTDAGVQVALDDFGSGYASLAVIRQLPLHKVKIDRSLVTRLDDPGEREITRRTIDLLHALDLVVVAEGVENESQRDLLTGLGCDQAQGFLFGRPEPVSPTHLD